MYKVLVAGATGKMGQQAVQLVQSKPDYEVAAILSPQADSANLELDSAVQRFTNLEQIDQTYDLWLDFTTPQAVFENTQFALNHQMRPIIGTSGLDEQQVQELTNLAQQQNLGGLIAPNFGLSAVLLLRFAQMAAEYFPDAEVIELHHADKKDAPSATALNTARKIQAGRKVARSNPTFDQAARGLDHEGVAIHAVRLPGYVAHEEVLFGGPGEALSIRQDSFERSSFMRGVDVALEKVPQLTQLVWGLENIL